jgi:hypothetical protein
VAAHGSAPDPIGQRKACLLSASPSFVGPSCAQLAASGVNEAPAALAFAIDGNPQRLRKLMTRFCVVAYYNGACTHLNFSLAATALPCDKPR